MGSKSIVPKNRVFLKGERIILREKNIKDLRDDYRWRTDPDLSELDATTPIYISFDDFSRQFHEEIFYGSLSSKRFSIDNIAREHIGNCMFYSFDSYRQQAELGIMIGDKKSDIQTGINAKIPTILISSKKLNFGQNFTCDNLKDASIIINKIVTKNNWR